MGRVLAIFGSDPSLKEITDRMGVRREHFIERVKFFERRLDEIRKSMFDDELADFELIGKRLIEMGQLESYDREKNILMIDRAEGVIKEMSEEEMESDRIQKAMRGLMGPIVTGKQIGRAHV